MAKQKPKRPPPKPPKFTWAISSDGTTVKCSRSPADNQFIVYFAEAKRLSSFHDAELAQVTKELNAILERVGKNNKNAKRKLAFLNTPKGLFLAWSEYGDITPYDDDAKIEKALGLS